MSWRRAILLRQAWALCLPSRIISHLPASSHSSNNHSAYKMKIKLIAGPSIKEGFADEHNDDAYQGYSLDLRAGRCTSEVLWKMPGQSLCANVMTSRSISSESMQACKHMLLATTSATKPCKMPASLSTRGGLVAHCDTTTSL